MSPVFDSGRTLLIAEIKNGLLANTTYLAFDFHRPLELVRMLRAEKVKVIVCGAISEETASMLLAAGFEVISFITGDVRRVLEALVKGDPLEEDFKMPGCGKSICCRGKIRRGREIGMATGGGCRTSGGRRRSPPAVGPVAEEMSDGATAAIPTVRLSGKS